MSYIEKVFVKQNNMVKKSINLKFFESSIVTNNIKLEKNHKIIKQTYRHYYFLIKGLLHFQLLLKQNYKSIDSYAFLFINVVKTFLKICLKINFNENIKFKILH